MHFACARTSSGMPLSGVPITSCKTAGALSSRSFAASNAESAHAIGARLKIAVALKTRSFLIRLPLFSLSRKPSVARRRLISQGSVSHGRRSCPQKLEYSEVAHRASYADHLNDRLR